MTYCDLQRAIAELVCDDASLRAFTANADAWLHEHRIAGHDAILLRDLDVRHVHDFQQIHHRDRGYFIETILPLTTRRLGASWHERYFAAHPYADDDARVEARHFAEHLAHDPHARVSATLARYELAKFLLIGEPAFEPAPTQPATLDHLALARGLAIVPSNYHLPTLIDEPQREPWERSGVAVLRRDERDVTSAWVEDEAALLLRLAHDEDQAGLAAAATDPASRDALDELIEGGILR